MSTLRPQYIEISPQSNKTTTSNNVYLFVPQTPSVVRHFWTGVGDRSVSYTIRTSNKDQLPRFNTSLYKLIGDSFVRLSEEEENEENNKEVERKVLYPNSFNIECIRAWLFWFLNGYPRYTGKRFDTLYYGVSVVRHCKGNTSEEEADLLNKEVGFKDAVRKIVSKYSTLQSIPMRPLPEEQTIKWILENRIQPSDDKSWDFLLSVNMDANDISEELLEKISQKGIRNLYWLILSKSESGNMRLIDLCESKFIAMVFPRWMYCKE